MAEVHQLYVTHCTYGSSALERREGDLAHRMLGYSARAGSLEPIELRRCYRQIERYLYYYLPRDTPPEDKLSLTASSAPRRLVFLPSAGGLQMLAQVCYRPTDTQGRPGSYFAHVLCQDSRDGSRPWSALECLRLWSAPGWVQEDRAEIPFLLPPLSEPDDLLYGQRPAIDDRLLRHFLTAEGQIAMEELGRVIPARWRTLGAAQRRKALEQTLQGILDQGRQRDGLLLVVEAEMAALLFYGAVRLLPPGPWCRGLSFSTFEPNPDRLCTLLAATQFHDPRSSDLRAEAYRTAGPAIINTFLDHRGTSGTPAGPYAAWIVQRLVSEGWHSVDLALDHLKRCQPQSVDDLDCAAKADRALPTLLAGSRPDGDDWRRGLAAEYLGHAVRGHLTRVAGDPTALERLLGTSAQIPLIELAGTQCDPQCRPAIAHLLKNVPDAWIGEVSQLSQVSREDKVALLARYVTSHAELPPGSEWIWKAFRAGDPLLAELLARLDGGSVDRFYASSAGVSPATFVLALLAACRPNPALRSSLSEVMRTLDEEQLVGLLFDHGEMLREYPADEPALPERLRELLTKLPLPLAHFSRRLDAILAAAPLLANDRLRQLAQYWSDCRRELLVLGRLQGQVSPLTRRRPWLQIEDALRKAATALNQAFPAGVLQDDRRGTFKLRYLRQLAAALLGAEALPRGPWRHDALWERAHQCLARGSWPGEPLARFRPPGRRWSPIAAVVAAAVVLLVLASLVAWKASTGRLRVGLRKTDKASPMAATAPEEIAEPTSASARQDPLLITIPQGDLPLHFTIDTLRTTFTTSSQSKAMVSVVLQGAGSQEMRLASITDEGLSVRCRVWKSCAEGPPRSELIPAEETLNSIEIGGDVRVLWLSLQFFCSPAGPPGQRSSLLATSVPARLEPDGGVWYQITFQLSDEQLNGLRARAPLRGPREF